MRIKNRQDALAGLLLVTISIVGLWLSRDYPVGSPTEMGKGFVPRLLLWILLALGLIIGGRSAVVSGDPSERLDWRPLLLITAAVVAFGLTIERLGLVAAGLLVIVLGGHAGRDVRRRELAVAAVLLLVGTALLFVGLIRLPIQLWPSL